MNGNNNKTKHCTNIPWMDSPEWWARQAHFHRPLPIILALVRQRFWKRDWKERENEIKRKLWKIPWWLRRLSNISTRRQYQEEQFIFTKRCKLGQIVDIRETLVHVLLCLYYMACVCSRYNACSNWLTVGHYSPIMPTGWLRACKNKAKSHIINNLLTESEVFTGKSQTSTLPYDVTIAQSIRQGLGLRFSRKDLTLC